MIDRHELPTTISHAQFPCESCIEPTNSMPKVNPTVLIWARESAGLTLDDAAKAVIGGVRAVARLVAIENGDVDPTRVQLSEMAKKYHRPLLTFYLSEPPEAATRTHDFRTVRAPQPAPEGRLHALVRDMTARQAMVVDALEESDEAEPLTFVGSAAEDIDAAALATMVVEIWRLDLISYRAARTVDDAFKVFREAVERSGVFVILQGNLGHHTSNIGPRVFRGFALTSPIAPFIVINETDARSAWTFTLLHELCHILLGQSGVSGYDSDNALERLCDDAAARVLLGTDDLRAASADLGDNALGDFINQYAHTRKVSRTMVAYNLMRSGRISGGYYAAIAGRFVEEREERQPKTGSGSVDYYVVKRHRVGQGLLRVVDRLIAGGSLSSTKAAKVLGVSATAVGHMTANVQAA